MADSTPAAPPAQPPAHDRAECVACRIADRLTEQQRDHGYWHESRAQALRLAVLTAQQECPAHRAAWEVDA